MSQRPLSELYEDMMENVSNLLCDICVIEALYHSRAARPQFYTLPALGEEIWRTQCFLDQHAHDTGTEGCVCADREVDARRDQAEQHAAGQQRRKRRLLEYRHQVAVSEKFIAAKRQYDAQNQQRGQCAENGIAIGLLFLIHLTYLPMLPSSGFPG